MISVPSILRFSFFSFSVLVLASVGAHAQSIEWKSLGGPQHQDGTYQAIRKVVPLAQGPIFILGAGLYRSDNRGSTWYKLSNARDFVFSADSTLYAAGDDGVFLSTNFGLSWTSLNDQLPTQAFNNIALTPKGTLVACTDYSIYRSTDKGVDWDHVGTNIPVSSGQMQMAMTPKGTLMLNFAYQSYRSTNDGVTWVTAASAPAEFTVARPGVLLAGYLTGEVERSTNDGVTWKQVMIPNYSSWGFGKPAMDIRGWAYMGSEHYSGDGVLVYSRDSGLSWQYEGTCPDVWSLGFDTANELYAGTFASGMFRSLKPVSSVKPSQASFASLCIYPNPASRTLTLTGDWNTAESSISVFNEAGALVLSSSSTRTLDVSTLAPGTYYCVLRLDGTSQTVPFKIEK